MPHVDTKKLKEKAKESEHDPYDDEMFLDADGELSSEVSIDTGKPISRKKYSSKAKLHHHIIFKKNKAAEDTMSDYGKIV